MTPEQQEILRLKDDGLSRAQIGERLGISKEAVKSRLRRAYVTQRRIDPAIRDSMEAVGTDLIPRMVWDKTDPLRSVLLMPANDEDASVDLFKEALEEYEPLDRKLFAPRINSGTKGEYLAVIDIADIHFGKLSEVSETGHAYNVEVARHRMVEGTRALLEPIQERVKLALVGNDDFRLLSHSLFLISA